MTDHLQREKERIARMNTETAHDFHRIEFKEMCAQMIDEALRQHDHQLQDDVQTTLNWQTVYDERSGYRFEEADYGSIVLWLVPVDSPGRKLVYCLRDCNLYFSHQGGFPL